jgi:outer membrane protein OmpA-like peptidoglycan-associated protein
MTRARTAALLATLVGPLIAGCGPKKVASAPSKPSQALVVLLPDSNTGAVGRVRVSNSSGAAELVGLRESSLVISDRKPGAVTVMSEEEVKRRFADVIAALPPAPDHFTLFFRFESDELTDESRALVSEILKAVKQHAVPEVMVVGHTDTMGRPRNNVQLGLQRARMVRDFLVRAGLDSTLIEVASHGEADLLVPTANGVAEPRNRRVEISVR